MPRATGRTSLVQPRLDTTTVEDRWRLDFPEWKRYPALEGEYQYVQGREIDPFNQNVLKGDLPFLGNKNFLVLLGTSATIVEYRRIALPSGISTNRADSLEHFGEGKQLFMTQLFLLSAEYFRGAAAFKPETITSRFTAGINVNYVNGRERNVLRIDAAERTNRQDDYVGIQEAFFEVKLADLSPQYDFVSIRAGVQPMVSDFRGFIFDDFNLGIQ